MTLRPSSHVGRIVITLVIAGAMAGGVVAEANGPFAEGALEIRGTRLTLYDDGTLNDADQVVNVGERALVRTCYGANTGDCGTATASDPWTYGLEVRAELSGPELPDAIPLRTLPGGTFILPGFQQQGDYLLRNIRLVDTLTGEVLQSADPSIAIIRVTQIVLASATVTTLSLEDLEARGISITQENFQGYNFSVGFLFEGVQVDIELPVIYQGGGDVQALETPSVILDGLPPGTQATVQRWQPPHIVPFALEIPERRPLDMDEEVYVPITFPVFGAIVMPGSVSFLNQFFDATMIVANGAPEGTGIELHNLEASLKLPDGNVLRIAESLPPVAPGQQVPMVGSDGAAVIGPEAQAKASWTVEGLKAGTHVLRMDVNGELVRPGKPTAPVATSAQALVEVVDARFHLVFSHPDVVREETPYTLYVTVTNQSRVTQNLVSIEIKDERIVGARKADPEEWFVKEIESLEPGQSETLEFNLVAEVTGQVVGGTFEAAEGTGGIQLYTGVGELGIPLSPATLILPRFSERLAEPFTDSDEFLRAATRFLGLAYSLAVAPAAMTPPDLPRVIRTDVEERAVDLGFSGQRTFLGEGLLESLEVLLLDHLGNRSPLVEIDGLRRLTDKGNRVALELAELLRLEQEARGLDALALFDHFAETTSYADLYLAATLLPGDTMDTPVLEIRQMTTSDWQVLAHPGDSVLRVRTLEFGELVTVNEEAAGGREIPLAVVGSVGAAEHHDVFIRNSTDIPVDGRLLMVVGDAANGGYRRIDFGTVTVPPHTVYAVVAGADIPNPGEGGFQLINLASGLPVEGVTADADVVPLPPFEVIGARQDYGVAGGENRYGQGVSYLFNRPPSAESLADAASFVIRSTFDDGEEQHVDDKEGRRAFLQPSGRVVNVRYRSPLSALWDGAVDEPLLVHEHLIEAADLTDDWGNTLGVAVPPPAVENPPQHYGGLVSGKVLRGTGAPAANSLVQLIRPRLEDTLTGYKTVLDLVGEMTTGEDGAFYFDFVEQPHWDPFVQDEFVLRAVVPEGADPATEPAATEEVRSTIRLQNQITNINIALLGRGTVQGSLVYLDDGEPVVGGSVTAASTLFNDSATVIVEEDGSFEIPAMPVGPITLSGRDNQGRTVYATVGIQQPGEVVQVVLELPRTQPPGLGTVTGTVFKFIDEDLQPVDGATVAVYSGGVALSNTTTDAHGQFVFDNVPAGQVSVQAADWRISRTAVVVDLLLAADQTADVELVLPVTEPKSVLGMVYFDDPISGDLLPVEGAAVFIPGPGVFAYSDADGAYRIDGVPVRAAGEPNYQVSAIDTERQLQGDVEVSVIPTTPPEVVAQPIILREMRGGINGVVLDPLGRPVGGVSVLAMLDGVPWAEVTSTSDGTFTFNDLQLGEWDLIAHFGDGLEPGRVGWIGQTTRVRVVFGGHRPFASVQLVGSGVVDVQVTSGEGSSVFAEIYYRPTYYSEMAKAITLRGTALESIHQPPEPLLLELPVGRFEITAYSPFHGVRTVSGSVEWAGQSKTVEIGFDGSSTVSGTLVNVDGVTPIPDFPVTLHTESLLPQTLMTDATGRFEFAMVPEGRLEVRAEGPVGSVERVGRASAYLGSGGQNLELEVRMKAQGTVTGQVLELVGDEQVPLANAQFYVREESYPFRRLPAGSGWYSADADGRYEISHVYAGSVRVVARDASQLSRRGSSQGVIEDDWQVVVLEEIVLSTSVGTIEVVVRDPENGGPLPDTQVSIRDPWGDISEMTVADATGTAGFEALPLKTYSVTAFHAPTGRTGRLNGLVLSEPGQRIERDLYVDQRGAVSGTLFDDPGKSVAVPGGTVELRGQTAGGPLTALDTTSGQSETLGRFDFFGIPEGTFQLTAAAPGSPRRAGEEVALTATTPVVEVDLVLEPAGDVAFQVLESLMAGLSEVDPALTPMSVRLRQGSVYDFTRLAPQVPAPGHAFIYPGVLLERSGNLSVQELGGEQRGAHVSASNFVNGVPVDGSGSAADPYRVVLTPKGVVRVAVLDADGNIVPGASVTLTTGSGARFPSVAGDDGTAVFTSVPAGNLTITASAPLLGVGGRSTAVLQFDDEIVEVLVQLAAAVSAHGVVYEPVPGDVWNGDPEVLVPQNEAVVIFAYGDDQQVMVTGGDGLYSFDALPVGAGYTVTAQTLDGQAWGTVSGTLSGPNGNDNQVPQLILDAGPPQIVSITPPPGMEDVSRTATVEILFSEPLLAELLPTGQPTSSYFEIRGPGGLAAGSWNSGFTEDGQQLVLFVPSEPYANQSIYSLKIKGGPSGVRDRSGRPLTPFADVGSNFKTSDAIGPVIINTEPPIDRPVPGGQALRFDFNEEVVASDEQLDGDGEDDAAYLYWGKDDGNDGVTWEDLPATLYLTRNNYSLVVDPTEGVVLEGDTLQRRVTIAGLVDVRDNEMEPDERFYRIRDDNAPVIEELPAPPTAPGGQLTPGQTYTVTPVISGIDTIPPDHPEFGDMDRVEYFFDDPTGAGGPGDPAFVSTDAEFDFPLTFVAAYSGDGTTPKPFPVWARAIDTSTNTSDFELLEMVVLPNQAPTVGAVTAEAVSPVPGVPYAGSTVAATVGGIADPDGTQLSVVVQLWQEGGGFLAVAPTVSLQVADPSEWLTIDPPVLELVIPPDLTAGSVLFVKAQITDASGASAVAESIPFAVAEDLVPPLVEGLVARSAADDEPRTIFYIGQQLYLEFTARDVETDVVAVTAGLDRTDIFPDSLVATRVTGDLYRTGTVAVPIDIVTEPVTITATASAEDRGGNTGSANLAFEVAPEPDPTAPTVQWLTPWEGGPWPADYTSTKAPGVGAALLLRVRAKDLNEDENGDPVPGTIVAVEFRGPVPDGQGGVELSADGTEAFVVDGSEGPGEAEYELVWHVPDQIPLAADVPFEVRVVDSGGLEVTSTVRLQGTVYSAVHEGAQDSIDKDDPWTTLGGDEAGFAFLLDGSVVSLYHQTDGTLRSVSGLVLYAGGSNGVFEVAVAPSVLTSPAITSYGSSRLFYPLQLAVDQAISIGVTSRIDVSSRGPLGSTADDEMVLPGETGAARRAGGSHGGSGWYGAPDSGWNASSLYEPSSTYDSVRAPELPGAGGGHSGSGAGGTGGGVLLLHAPDAALRLVGEIRADGGAPQASAGGGAGGAVWITAGRVEGGGVITANGGSAQDSNRSGGGGGGRIALHVGELGSSFDLAQQVFALGGTNGGSFVAGGGTIYTESFDAESGDSTGIGALRIDTRSSRPAAATLLPGLGQAVASDVDPINRVVTLNTLGARGLVTGDVLVLEDDSGTEIGLFPVTDHLRTGDISELEVVATEQELLDLQAVLATETVNGHARGRYASVTASGASRLAVDGDLLVGPVEEPDPALNDPASIDLGPEARVILRGQEPGVVVSSAPAPGTEVLVGSTIEISWTASDPVGLWQVSENWPIGEFSRQQRYTSQPTDVTVDPDPLVLTVPATAEPGEATYELFVSDAAGRAITHIAGWEVLPNSPPTGDLAFAAGAPTTVQAGFSTDVVVHAEDLEGLASITLTATGPAVDPEQTVTATGTMLDVPFQVWVLPDANGSTPIIVQASVTDISGSSVMSETLEVTITPDETTPTVTIDLAPQRDGDLYGEGETVTITATPADDVGVTSLTVMVEDIVEVSDGSPIVFDWVAAPVDEVTDFVIAAEAIDAAGNTGTANRTVTIEPFINADAPVVTISCPISGDGCVPGGTTGLQFHMIDPNDGDEIVGYALYVDGDLYGEVDLQDDPGDTREVSGVFDWVTPEDASPGHEYSLRLEARDKTNNVGYAIVRLSVLDGTILTGDQLLTSDYSGQPLVLADGTFTATMALQPDSLTLLGGAKLTTQSLQQLIVQTTGDVSLACGTSIDVSARGYAGDQTYPGATPPDHYTGAGSHLGEGGTGGGTPGSTFGSVTRPQEAGGGGEGTGEGRRGGGVARIEAATVDVAGAIRANGEDVGDAGHKGGAGGSVWITAETVRGDGLIEARGGKYAGSYNRGSGGGGAISIEAASIGEAIQNALNAAAGDTGRQGGAGTIHLVGSESTYGDLIVANAGMSNPRWTILPSLGGGEAQENSGGAILVTDRTESIPAYFVGHWVRITKNGGAESYWRIESVDSLTVTLEAGADVAEGDLWQGVYRFDSVMVTSGSKLRSLDPILVPEVTVTDGSQLDVPEMPDLDALILGGGSKWSTVWKPVEVSGSVEVVGLVNALSIDSPLLTVRAGGMLSHPPGGNESLTLTVTEVVVEEGGAIDVSARGYNGAETYPGATLASYNWSGGSHMGEGGISSGTPASTFGSVYRPREAGGGGMHSDEGRRGGGVVRIESMTLDLAGVIRANGGDGSASSHRGGAGGSIWVTSSEIIGTGTIEARGGKYNGSYNQGSGGGGSIAIEAGAIDTVILDALSAPTGNSGRRGGAGTIFVMRQTSVYGDLFVDNAGINGGRWTILPALGGGEAQENSGGAILVTDRPQEIPAYFMGHWIEVRSPDETLKGTWRIESVENLTVTLEAGADVVPGDLWQGVYRFDTVTAAGNGRIRSDDPIRLSELVLEDGGQLEAGAPLQAETMVLGGGSGWSTLWTPISFTSWAEIAGPMNLRAIEGPLLTVRAGAVLSQPPGGTESLNIEVTDVVIEEGGAIDVSARGYGGDQTYPGATLASYNWAGGSHLGEGGTSSGTTGSTFGSVTRPREAGGGGRHPDEGRRGGGVLRIVSSAVDVSGAIRSNGGDGSSSHHRGGAGGSIWITASEISGEGVIEARGGKYQGSYNQGTGAGGSIAIESDYISAAVLGSLRAPTGNSGRRGGAGTVFVVVPSSTFGDLFVDNEGNNGRWTILPGLGGGMAQENSGGQTLVTDRVETIPQYFVGHWVRITASDDSQSMWRIESVDGVTVTLETGADVAEGDLWQGVYRFDSVTVAGNAKLRVDDHYEFGSIDVDDGSTIDLPNLGAPFVDQGLIDYSVHDGAVWVYGHPFAIRDDTGVSWARIRNATLDMEWDLSVAADGSFAEVAIEGLPGDELRIYGEDNHPDALGFDQRIWDFPEVTNPPSLTASLDVADTLVRETDTEVLVRVVLSESPLVAARLRIFTSGDTAVEGQDFQEVDEILNFDHETTEATVSISLIDDGTEESDESFTISLGDPFNIDLVPPTSAALTIRDDDSPIPKVTYSVGVGVGNFLQGPVAVDISAGVATFAEPLPPAPDRGDRIELAGLDPIFIASCADDTHCVVTDPFGSPPPDVVGAVAEVIAPAFGSLADAMVDAGSAEHLGTYDLVAIGRSLEIVCYGPEPDTTSVHIEGWETWPEYGIRIVAPTAGSQRGRSQRHQGAWSYDAYRLEVVGGGCLRTTVGNVEIEGLQIDCAEDPGFPVAAIHLDGVDGDVTISESLIRLDGPGASAERVGVLASSSVAAEVMVRNNVMWNLGGTELHSGISVANSDVTLRASNNTIVGGGYGISNLGGTAIVTNNLVASTSIASYEGDFHPDSTQNLAADGTAPDPPPSSGGPVAMVNPSPDLDADYHLECSELERILQVLQNLGEDEIWAVFDDDHRTLAISNSANPARVYLEFPEERTITGTSVVVSHFDSHNWTVIAYDIDGLPRVIVNDRSTNNGFMSWDGVVFDQPEPVWALELLVTRNSGNENDLVHLNEWHIQGLNPACGQGVDLSVDSNAPFSSDLDSRQRIQAWDIGADQSSELEIGFREEWHWWSEREDSALAQVVLSEPSDALVSVRYRTEDRSAISGEDFLSRDGELVFGPGEVSQTISVPLLDDGPGDADEFFVILLSDADGARVRGDTHEVWLNEEDGPVRLRLTETLIEVTEDVGVVTGTVEIDRLHSEVVYGVVDAFDESAFVASDYRGMPAENGAPWASFEIPVGSTSATFQFEIINDDVAEQDETFWIQATPFDLVFPGQPVVGLVQVIDDDSGGGDP